MIEILLVDNFTQSSLLVSVESLDVLLSFAYKSFHAITVKKITKLRLICVKVK